MPSGAKKRKAAKKKKIQHTDNNNSTHSHGGDEVKHYVEKESDGREVGSFASQESHESGHPFADGGDDGSGKSLGDSAARVIAPESNSVEKVSDGDDVQKVSGEAEEGVRIEWEVKLEEDYKSKNISIESIKEEVHNGLLSTSSSSSSSSSSSDDESLAVEDKTPVVETGVDADSVETLPEVVGQLIENITVEENDDKVVESSASVHPVKLDSSLSDMLNKVNDIILAKETDNGVVETEHADSLKPMDRSSEVVGEVIDTVMIGGTGCVDFKTVSFEPEKEPLIQQTVQVIVSNPSVNPDTSRVEWDPQETGVKENLTLYDSNAVSPDLLNLGSIEKELSTSKTTATSTDTKDSSNEVHEDKLKLSYNSPVGNTTSGAELVADYQNPEHSSHQPLVASGMQREQKTSIKSCCGFLELFTSSDR